MWNNYQRPAFRCRDYSPILARTAPIRLRHVAARRVAGFPARSGHRRRVFRAGLARTALPFLPVRRPIAAAALRPVRPLRLPALRLRDDGGGKGFASNRLCDQVWLSSASSAKPGSAAGTSRSTGAGGSAGASQSAQSSHCGGSADASASPCGSSGNAGRGAPWSAAGSTSPRISWRFCPFLRAS